MKQAHLSMLHKYLTMINTNKISERIIEALQQPVIQTSDTRLRVSATPVLKNY